MYIVIVWHNLNKDTYYHKIIKGLYKNYYIGYINQYNHKIIDIIPNVYLKNHKVSLRKKVLKKLISFLQKINN